MALVTWLKWPMYSLTGLSTVAAGALYIKQNELIYPRYMPPGARTEEGVPKPEQFGISDAATVKIPTTDGETLHAYLVRPSNKSHAVPVTILMLHGNAGNIGHRLPIAKVLEELVGCKILLLEYRGYGLSTGEPSESGLIIDAHSALRYIQDSDECCNDRIVVYGQSLGGAVATRLVADLSRTSDASSQFFVSPVKGLILENTFTSMQDLIPSVLPAAKFLARLCHQKWDTKTQLPLIRQTPILFLSGLKDEIIPSLHMKQLRDCCRSRDITWREFPNGTHNETMVEPGFFHHIADFIRQKCP